MSPQFQSWLAPRFERFVALKRAGGAKYISQVYLLAAFDSYLEEHAPAEPLRRDTLVAYLATLDRLSPRGCDNMVDVVWQALASARRHGARIDNLPPRPRRAPEHFRLQPPRLITREEIGAILAASVEPYQATDTVAHLTVQAANYGDLKSDYLVTVTDCGPEIAPVVAQSVTLEPFEEHEFTFDLMTTGTFSASDQCTVTLRSTTGRVYGDPVVVTFPPPTEGAQASGPTPVAREVPAAAAATGIEVRTSIPKPAGAAKHQTTEIAELRARVASLEALVAQLTEKQNGG